ncbi:Aste57867_9476 [Aphanomyces stellatus]|uniref:Aste57867_9476 protein n=1 Tax=Aphanomyces stellatus TaxID=120398 RepID=A0A485KNG8_9STRA|nr:hypothetical protein As57867_009439 [Aphanomyces stellatus]VFT86355.1 Aste57867_9476 [Aphanomyces stellatus]
MVFSKTSAEQHAPPVTFAAFREQLVKEDMASTVVKPPHKVVPPFDNDQQVEETQRRSIAKRVKRAMIAELLPRRSNTPPQTTSTATSEQLHDSIMQVFAAHDPRNRGKLPWNTFVQLVDSAFHVRLNDRERTLFRVHLHVPEGGAISYVKFVSHVFEESTKSKKAAKGDAQPEQMPPPPLALGLPLLQSVLDDTDTLFTQQEHGKRAKNFLARVVKAAALEANLWHVPVQDVLHRAMASGGGDDDSTLTQTAFYTAMYVALNVQVDAIEADVIFQQLAPQGLLTVHDLHDAVVRFNLLHPIKSTTLLPKI